MSAISVIVPIYNAEKHLQSCIDSILAQTFTDFELLLINDGSKDNSGSICDEYVIKDNRVRVFHKENGGVRSARNQGLDNAIGEWVTFVDSDDWIEYDFLKKLIFYTRHQNVMFISSGYRVSMCEKNVLITDDFHLLFSENSICYTVPWGKLYKINIIKKNNIRFNENMQLGEDTVFLYTFISCINTFCIIGDIGYHYNRNSDNSLSKRIFSFESEMIIYNSGTSAINQLILNKKISGRQAIERLALLKVFFTRRVLNSLYYNKIKRKTRIAAIKSIDHSLFSSVTWPQDWKDKIYTWLLTRRCYVCYDFLRSFTSKVNG